MATSTIEIADRSNVSHDEMRECERIVDAFCFQFLRSLVDDVVREVRERVADGEDEGDVLYEVCDDEVPVYTADRVRLVAGCWGDLEQYWEDACELGIDPSDLTGSFGVLLYCYLIGEAGSVLAGDDA